MAEVFAANVVALPIGLPPATYTELNWNVAGVGSKVCTPVPVNTPVPVIERQVLPVRQPADPGVRKPALNMLTVKPKVSPASVVEKSWIGSGVLFPII